MPLSGIDGVKPTRDKADATAKPFKDFFTAIEELLRNAIAVGNKFSASQLDVSLKQSELKKMRYLCVLDNGCGMSYETVDTKLLTNEGGGKNYLGAPTLVSCV
jgi:anti-sigma regulatory factor (Ser/Thr protein kinase)